MLGNFAVEDAAHLENAAGPVENSGAPAAAWNRAVLAGMRGLPSNGLGVGVEGLFLAEKHTQRQHQLAGPEEKVCKVVFRVDTLQQ